ncbi:DNA polymerase subunit beta [Sphaerisporangium rufum]|uniref:DNA polymerase subunit beta n=1 Tax=Sphaerisporangium rufum TaxID=1381558 RepID=A0A919R8X2_9ACTN|nr:nucleotidyltransferase domain-containing protein [Sphaerisporangium rufum]GII80350.1 DNA polymerase subunit beta [Sphaerisporangium rufum]
MTMSDADLLDHVTRTLAALPGVHAVTLGGSRASGAHRPDSDWDFAVYYRGAFRPGDLRALGWPGEVSEIGGWGGGVFNGGAWLQVAGRAVDVHYRDLDEVEHHLAEARAGRFGVERLMFHLAGIPTYIVVAELALGRAVAGELPRPDYPPALRAAAPPRWWGDARATLDYAAAHARAGRLAETAGSIATAACQTAHAVLAARGVWATNDKTLLDRAGLRRVDEILATAPGRPVQAIEEAGAFLARAAAAAGVCGAG